jgi:hypothetical protein
MTADLRIRCHPLSTLRLTLRPQHWSRSVPLRATDLNPAQTTLIGQQSDPKVRIEGASTVYPYQWRVILNDGHMPALDCWSELQVKEGDDSRNTLGVVGLLTFFEDEVWEEARKRPVLIATARIWTANRLTQTIFSAVGLGADWWLAITVASIGTDGQVRLVGFDDVSGAIRSDHLGQISVPVVNVSLEFESRASEQRQRTSFISEQL